MRVFVGAALALAALGAGGAASAAAPTLRDGQDLYTQNRVPEAAAAFRAVAADPDASGYDKVEAWRSLARIQWLIDKDDKGALASLDAALALKTDPCGTVIMRARVLDESGSPHDAALWSRAHRAECPGDSQSDDVTVAEARALLDDVALKETPAERRTRDLDEAGALFRRLSADADAWPAAQSLRMEWALNVGDPKTALEGWKGFFWVTDHNAPAAFKVEDAEVERRFTTGLRPDATVQDQIGVLELLLRGGFYKKAQRFDASRQIAARAGADPVYARVLLYMAMRKDVDALILAYDRATARGHQDDKSLLDALAARLNAWQTKIGVDDAKTRGGVHDSGFGVYGALGITEGYAGLNAGHIVQDEELSIEQFGRKGHVRFVVVENMISNGYETWLWDGLGETGGWSGGDGVIVQVRSTYTGAGLGALASFQPEMAKRDAELQPGLEKSDLQVLATRPVAYLPGVQARLMKQSAKQVADRARAEAARTGQPFARVFVKLYWDLTLAHSIVVHEGRHALDQAEFQGKAALSPPELEYRAKLSELQLSELPRLPLGNLMSPEIGGQTPHGIADARLMEGYRQWMEAHRGEVKGFDPKVPTLEQLDKLSDPQIRVVAQGLDPQFRQRRTDRAPDNQQGKGGARRP
ncbi:MAG: hypothetical protein JSR45_07440 [Proteobacteria bacterium]|nr:hypothetical protein [Pseudomonadota bacterium]